MKFTLIFNFNLFTAEKKSLAVSKNIAFTLKMFLSTALFPDHKRLWSQKRTAWLKIGFALRSILVRTPPKAFPSIETSNNLLFAFGWFMEIELTFH